MNLLITGGAGFLGQHLTRFAVQSGKFERVFAAWNQTVPAPTEDVLCHQADLTNAENCDRLLQATTPTHIIHAAALSSLDACEKYPDLAQRTNVTATQNLLNAANLLPHPPHFTFVSTDLVFAGDSAPYHENATPDPIQVYGKSKATAETAVIKSPMWPKSCIVRSSLIYGASIGVRDSFLQWMVAGMERGELTLFSDEIRNPISVYDLCNTLTILSSNNRQGIYHAAGEDSESRFEFGRRVATVAALDFKSVHDCTRKAQGLDKLRPENVTLSTDELRKLNWLPTPTDDSLERILGSYSTQKRTDFI